MPDAPAPKKVLGINRTYLILGGLGLSAGLLYAWWNSTHSKKKSSSSTSSTIVITGSTSSNTGISGALLNAILKDWQEHPSTSTATSTSTGTSTGTVKVPDVVGMSATDAANAIRGAGLVFGTGGVAGNATVTAQSPSAGTSVAAGSSVTITAKSASASKTTSKTSTSKKTSVTYTSYTVQKGQTLAEIAKQFGISVAQLAHSNVYVKGELPGNAKVGQTLGTGAGLKTGQVLKIPHYKTTSS